MAMQSALIGQNCGMGFNISTNQESCNIVEAAASENDYNGDVDDSEFDDDKEDDDDENLEVDVVSNCGDSNHDDFDNSVNNKDINTNCENFSKNHLRSRNFSDVEEDGHNTIQNLMIKHQSNLKSLESIGNKIDSIHQNNTAEYGLHLKRPLSCGSPDASSFMVASSEDKSSDLFKSSAFCRASSADDARKFQEPSGKTQQQTRSQTPRNYQTFSNGILPLLSSRRDHSPTPNIEEQEPGKNHTGPEERKIKCSPIRNLLQKDHRRLENSKCWRNESIIKKCGIKDNDKMNHFDEKISEEFRSKNNTEKFEEDEEKQMELSESEIAQNPLEYLWKLEESRRCKNKSPIFSIDNILRPDFGNKDDSPPQQESCSRILRTTGQQQQQQQLQQQQSSQKPQQQQQQKGQQISKVTPVVEPSNDLPRQGWQSYIAAAAEAAAAAAKLAYHGCSPLQYQQQLQQLRYIYKMEPQQAAAAMQSLYYNPSTYPSKSFPNGIHSMKYQLQNALVGFMQNNSRYNEAAKQTDRFGDVTPNKGRNFSDVDFQRFASSLNCENFKNGNENYISKLTQTQNQLLRSYAGSPEKLSTRRDSSTGGGGGNTPAVSLNGVGGGICHRENSELNCSEMSDSSSDDDKSDDSSKDFEKFQKSDQGAPGSQGASPPGKGSGKGKEEFPNAWPAWVYCTRYSDRPSSGPRTRKAKKKDKFGSSDEKRPRTAFTADQLARLKHEFDDNKYLTEERRQNLAVQLQLNESQIKIWFQNKRAKIKKASGVRNGLALQLMAQGLYNHSSSSS